MTTRLHVARHEDRRLPVTSLRGITWDHPRGIRPLEAASAEFARRTGITVSWTARPLHAFEDTPLAELAAHCDLLAIDHPFIGDAVDADVLAPLDDLLSREVLADRAADSAGSSHASYAWRGRQWALGVDAACMVTAYRPDLTDGPGTAPAWSDAIDLARRLGRARVLLPANPTHAWGTFLSLCESVTELPDERDAEGRPAWWPESGIDNDTATAAWARLTELLAVCAPESLGTDPITALERLGATDEIAYVPLVFGYVTYARADSGMARVRFTDAPGLRATGGGTLTGGVGLAITAGSEHPDAAAAFLEYVSSASVQTGLFAQSGGQPGRRSAWTSPDADAEAGGFFGGTLATMERSFLRPRGVGYPRFQVAAAASLHHALSMRVPAVEGIASIQRLWEDHVPVSR
jgi:multiple sugar transport system substrate-binding protein